MCWALCQPRARPSFQGFPKVMTRIPRNRWGSEEKVSQTERKKVGRGGKEERGAEDQIQGRASWPDDLENHFPFPYLRFLQNVTWDTSSCWATCTGAGRGERAGSGPGRHTPPLQGDPPSVSGPLTSTLQRFSAAAHQKPKLYFCPLFALLRPSFWGIFSPSSSLDQWFSAGGIFAPQGTFLAMPRDIFGCWLEGTTGIKWPGARLLLSALQRAGQP